jgi:23S rRNA pseudouridine1911/1915/1917 synthase
MANLNHGFEYQEILGADAAGLTIIGYLTKRYPGFTREDWLVRIAAGRVLLDGIPSGQGAVLRPGRRLSWLRPPWEEPEVPLSYAILYQDSYLLAVAKPAGLPTNPGGGIFMEHTLLALVRRKFPGASPLHRLGRGTSGIVLFAIAPDVASRISQAWCGGEILKVYRALATGCPAVDEFEVDTPIGPIPHRILKSIFAACPGGKAAHSHISVLERREGCSLLQVRITTGRPHQIRIHLSAAGHPLLVDPLYAAGGVPAENSRALPGDQGYSLHNGLLGFPHPVSGRWTEIHCMPPPSLRLRSGSDPE